VVALTREDEFRLLVYPNCWFKSFPSGKRIKVKKKVGCRESLKYARYGGYDV
jgi:hypothetical protein